MLELIELFADLVKSDEWQAQGTTQMLLGGALDCDLPSSLTMLLLNTLPRLERLLGLQKQDQHFEPNATSLANVAALAMHCGLGGVFTKEVDAIWGGPEREPKHIKPMNPAPKQKPETANEAKLEAKQEGPTPIANAASTLAITTNVIADGRQWKIAGTLVSEVREVQGLGHVGTFYAGSFQFKTRAYSSADLAIHQCRDHVEGVLKMLKIMPR